MLVLKNQSKSLISQTGPTKAATQVEVNSTKDLEMSLWHYVCYPYIQSLWILDLQYVVLGENG